jgi:hypothetical protein
MRLVADNAEDYQMLSRIQKLLTQAFKVEKENNPNGVLALTHKKFINTSIEKSYERPGQSAQIANAEDVMDTTDKSLFIAYIVMAATQRKKMAVQYRDAKGNVSQRVLEPFNWRNNQVVAWCHERGAWRQFKPSQMERVAVTNEPFDREEVVEIKASDAKDMAHLVNG